MKENVRIDCERIIAVFGERKQILKIAEECSELSAAIIQSHIGTKCDEQCEENIYQELADVYNMMKQALCIYDAEKIMAIAKKKRKKTIKTYC